MIRFDEFRLGYICPNIISVSHVESYNKHIPLVWKDQVHALVDPFDGPERP